jgi:outer membrane protein assembly factor BamB
VATDDRILLPFAETHNARLLMVDAGSGELQWAASAEGSLSSPPLVTDRLVILGLAQRDPDADVAEQPGAVVAFERTTGRALWSVTTPDPVLTTPIAVGDSLYVMSADELVGCH